MKLTTLTLAFAVAGAVALAAQSTETTTKTKVEIKDGKSVSVTGCVARMPEIGYVLTNVADKDGSLHRYVLVSDNDDFSKVVGHRVQIDGKATDRDNGKVTVKSETKTEGEDKDSHATTEMSGDMSFVPYLGVDHMKDVAASCP